MTSSTERLSIGKMQQQELKHLLRNPNKITPEQVILLQQLAVTYPAFTALQVCLWRVYKLNNHLLLEVQQRKVLAMAPEDLFLWEEVLPSNDSLEVVEPKHYESVSLSKSIESQPNYVIEAESIHSPKAEIETNATTKIEEQPTNNTDIQFIINNEELITEAINETLVQGSDAEVIIEEIGIHEETSSSIDTREEISQPIDNQEITQDNSLAQSLSFEDLVEEKTKANIEAEVKTNPIDNDHLEAIQPIDELDDNAEITEFEGFESDLNLEVLEENLENEENRLSVFSLNNSAEEELSDKEKNNPQEGQVGSSPEMSFSQWLVWIQERKSKPIPEPKEINEVRTEEPKTDNSINTDDSIEKVRAEEPSTANSSNTDDLLEKLYQQHMSAEYLKLEEPTGTSLQEEALERVKRAESGEKNSFNLQQIAKDSLDETLIPVSETLAKIYESQEEWKRALTVYEKLLLQFPDKTLLFAAKIQELKTKI